VNRELQILASKTKRSFGVRRAILIVTALAIAGVISLLSYQLGAVAGSRTSSDEAYKRAVISARISSLYRTTRDAALGGITQSDLYTVYDNMLTPELAARLKHEGAPAVFCSSKTPIDMIFDSPNTDAANGTLQVHLNFTVRSSTLSAEKNALVGFDAASSRLTSITCM
jgi:hypothetical protein